MSVNTLRPSCIISEWCGKNSSKEKRTLWCWCLMPAGQKLHFQVFWKSKTNFFFLFLQEGFRKGKEAFITAKEAFVTSKLLTKLLFSIRTVLVREGIHLNVCILLLNIVKQSSLGTSGMSHCNHERKSPGSSLFPYFLLYSVFGVRQKYYSLVSKKWPLSN